MSLASAFAIYHLESVGLLTGASNFETWKEGIRPVIQELELAGHIVGDGDVFPLSPKPEACSQEFTTPQRAAFRLWWKEDLRALTIIKYRLSPAIRKIIPQGDSLTAQQTWSFLCQNFGPWSVGVMAQLALREHLYGIKLENYADVDQDIGEFLSTSLRFAQMGDPF